MAVAAQTIRPAFEWDFLRTLAWWSAFAALGVGALGALLTQDLSFVVSFAVAAAIDVATLLALTAAGRDALDHGGSGAARIPLLVGVRLGLKAALLLLAAVLPTVSFLGVALGVLVVDTTVLVGGSIAAAVKTFGRPRTDSAGQEGSEAGE
jgi:hypothetical protein